MKGLRNIVVGGNLLILLGFSTATGQQRSTVGEPVWVADASRAAVSPTPARGRFLGKPFSVGRAYFTTIEVYDQLRHPGKTPRKEYDGYAIYLSQGTRMTQADALSLAFGTNAPSNRFEITLYLQPGKSLAGRTILVTAHDTVVGQSSPQGKAFLYQHSPPVSVTLVPRGKDVAGSLYLDETAHAFTLRLHIDRQTEKTLRGSIYLCTNEGTKSFVAGQFSAQTLDDAKLLHRPKR